MTISNNGPMSAEQYEPLLSELEARLGCLIDQEVDEGVAAGLNDCISAIRTLGKNADADRKKIKEPHLTAGKQVDDDFRPISTKVKSLVDSGKKVVTAYIIEQQRIAKEAEEKALAEERERQRIADAMKDDALIGETVVSEAEAASEAALIAKAETENAGRIGSMSGGARAMSLRVSYSAQIENPAIAAAHFADHPRVQDAIIQAANAILRGADRPDAIPGITINEIKKVA